MSREQEIQEHIEGIVNHVEDTTNRQNKTVMDVNNAIDLLETEQENLSVFLEEKLNQILSTKFKLDKKLEQQKAVRDQESQNIAVLEDRLSAAIEEEKKAESDKIVSQERVEAAKKALDDFKAEAEKVSEMAANVPKLSQNKKLYYSISRLTFDKAAKPNQIKGFVVNPRKDDVNTFNFTTGEESGISSHFVTNYLWDLIAAGAAPEWDQV